MMRIWWRSLFSRRFSFRRDRRPVKPLRRYYRLCLESLEDRLAPATLTWDGGGANDNWTTAANWVGDVAPNPGDDLVFAGTVRLTPNNNFPTNTPFHSLAFSAGG